MNPPDQSQDGLPELSCGDAKSAATEAAPSGWRETLNAVAQRFLDQSNQKTRMPQWQRKAYAHAYAGVVNAIHALEGLVADQSACAASDAAQVERDRSRDEPSPPDQSHTRIAELEAEPKLFYVMSLKWTGGEHITWWGPDNSGYTVDLARAGTYTAEQIAEHRDYYDSGRRADGSLAIPVEAAERLVKPVRYVPWCPSTYQKLRRARSRARALLKETPDV